jgi:hypothetical protein
VVERREVVRRVGHPVESQVGVMARPPVAPWTVDSRGRVKHPEYGWVYPSGLRRRLRPHRHKVSFEVPDDETWQRLSEVAEAAGHSSIAALARSLVYGVFGDAINDSEGQSGGQP